MNKLYGRKYINNYGVRITSRKDGRVNARVEKAWDKRTRYFTVLSPMDLSDDPDASDILDLVNQIIDDQERYEI